MHERVIGVLGGMGPEATVVFLGRIIALTPAAHDQDHLRVIVDCNPKIPDRTEAILGRGPSPLPMMASSVDALERAGAEVLVIPCASAHAFIDDLARLVSLPVVSMFDAVADAIAADRRGLRRVGLLSTRGTLRAAAFERRLLEAGLTVVAPPEEDQSRVDEAIASVKAGASPEARRATTRALCGVADRLVGHGAQAVVLGCTELPLVLTASDTDVPLFDSLEWLARAAVRAAGREPLPSLSLPSRPPGSGATDRRP